MILYCHDQYNINLGIFNNFHPFDGLKFSKVMKATKETAGINITSPSGPTGKAILNEFFGDLLRRLVERKRFILNALELPYMRYLPFSIIDKRILLPMRWAVQGTIDSTIRALSGTNCWNLGGGFHHASKNSSEGFCIYNDIGIACQEALKSGTLKKNDRVLIIDVDAHHGNGNAHTFLYNENVIIVDIYNEDVYPQSTLTRSRVDIPVPLKKGCAGKAYLEALDRALGKISRDFRIAFVIAGTDVLATDALGGMALSIDDVCERDTMIMKRLKALSIPTVVLGGGGYGKESAGAVIKSLLGLHKP